MVCLNDNLCYFSFPGALDASMALFLEIVQGKRSGGGYVFLTFGVKVDGLNMGV